MHVNPKFELSEGKALSKIAYHQSKPNYAIACEVEVDRLKRESSLLCSIVHKVVDQPVQ